MSESPARPAGFPAAAAGRADLVRAYAAGGEAALAAMAGLLDFEGRALVEPAPAAATGKEASLPVAVLAPVRSEGSVLAPIPSAFAHRVTHLAPPPERHAGPTVARLGIFGLGDLPGRPPRAPALAPAARLWAALRRRLASTTPSREVDVAALADRWSRGEPVAEMPFRPLAAWASRVVVLDDRSDLLRPFWQDQERLLQALARRLGRSAVQAVRFLDGYRLPWRDERQRYDEPPVVAGAAVLVLSDLGLLSGGPRRRAWNGIAARLRRKGVRPAALVLAPPNGFTASPGPIWDATLWGRPGGAVRATEPLSAAACRGRAERLLSLLSFSSRFDPALLRSVRRLLPPREADLGTEADAWNHPEVAGGDAPAVGLPRAFRERLQARFAAESDDLKRRVVDLMRRFRAGQPREEWLQEVASLAAAGKLPAGALGAEEIEAAEALWRRIAATVQAKPEDAPVVARQLRGWVVRAVDERVSPTLWEDPRWRPALWEAWKASWQGKGDLPVPAGAGPADEGEGAGESEVARWQAREVGGTLRFRPATAFGEDPKPGSPLAELESQNGRITIEAAGARYAVPHALATGQAPLPPGDFTLRTDRTVVHLKRRTRPAWAAAFGRDRFCLWATLEISGVEQRMRWIPPGRFWMGSPEDEPGRWDDEGPRHLEEIRAGFWLGETPCTQAFWQAVTGTNPSRFPSPDRPVEQVSWSDCREFLGKLGRDGEDGETWRLPTEAEWEYACRAGTETATYAGPIEILGAYNAPAVSPVAWYGGNSGVDDLADPYDSTGWPEKEVEHTRAGTHPVAQKAPNGWGLYDMLGNVFEWCEDTWRPNYAVEPAVNPDPGSDRVIRGGSWFSDARSVRAAYRIPSVPTFRWSILGFRLARGQGPALQPGAEPGGAERPTRGRARRGTRRPGPGSRPEAATE